MEALKLEDLVPRGATFNLRSTGKTYRLNPLSLADEIWLRETFGDELESILREGKVKPICRIVFHVMNEEDKLDFKKQTARIMNEDGDEATVNIGGPMLLLAKMSGYEEKIEMIRALLETIGISRPVLEKLASDEEKKSQLSQHAGMQSSMSSRQSTDGPPNTSSAEPPVNLPGVQKRSRKGKATKRNS